MEWLPGQRAAVAGGVYGRWSVPAPATAAQSQAATLFTGNQVLCGLARQTEKRQCSCMK